MIPTSANTKHWTAPIQANPREPLAAIPVGAVPVYESAAYPTSLARRRPYSASVIDPDFFS